MVEKLINPQNPLGKTITPHEGSQSCFIERDYYSHPTPDTFQQTNGFSGIEYIEEKVIIKPVIVVTVSEDRLPS